MSSIPGVHGHHPRSDFSDLSPRKVLDAVFGLMKDTGMTFDQATQTLSLNVADIDTGDFQSAFSDQSSDFQTTLQQGADTLPTNLRTVVDRPLDTPQSPTSPTADPAAPTADPSTPSMPTSTSGAPTAPQSPAGAPQTPSTPGPAADTRGPSIPSLIDAVTRSLSSTTPNAPRSETPSLNISSMIQAVFGGADGKRADAVQTLGPTLQNSTSNQDAARSEGFQGLAAMVQRFLGNAGSARAEAPPAPADVVHARTDGNAANAALNQVAVAPAAQQQGAQQASAFAGQQSAFADQQAQRTASDSPLPSSVRTGDGAASSYARTDAAIPTQAPDRTLAAQQQLQAQSVPVAYGRPDVVPAQIATVIAGATVLANTQASTLPSQVITPTTLSMPPLPPGNESAAAQARENLILPSGHTLMGNFRRDLRGGAHVLNKPIDWVLALMPGNTRSKESGEGESMSFQWVFWLLTVVTYASIAIAIVAMMPGRGGLLDTNGAPSLGAYALIIGAAAAIASWFVGKGLAKRHS